MQDVKKKLILYIEEKNESRLETFQIKNLEDKVWGKSYWESRSWWRWLEQKSCKQNRRKRITWVVDSEVAANEEEKSNENEEDEEKLDPFELEILQRNLKKNDATIDTHEVKPMPKIHNLHDRHNVLA